ncbi:TPA: DUF551 domain-containing protein [Escherichia coli]|nr:DUF551 domain-containing protein [Escherichia coli]
MTTITRKEQKQVLIDTANHVINRDNTSPYSENLRELARIALASLEAKPIGAFHIAEQQVDGTSDYIKDGEWPIDNGTIEVYAAPPVLVVPAALPENDDEDGHDIDYLEPSEVYALGRTAGWNACREAMLQAGNFRENKDSSTNNFREITETSTNYPVIPSEVLSAIQKVAKIRADFDDFDGDRRGIGDCLDEAEQELIVTINKYASQLAAEPIATNDVREQTAVPPVPVIQADVAQAIEKLKRKLVECNRYNYCADAVKGVEDACRAVSYSHADNQPASGNQAAESNRGNEWTGNPDIDNAIIMLDRIDTLESFDDDRIEAVKAVLRRLAGNYPVTPDGWISCSERMPDKLIPVMVMYEDGEMWSAMWNGNRWDDGTEYPDPHSVTHWREMPAAPQQEVK